MIPPLITQCFAAKCFRATVQIMDLQAKYQQAESKAQSLEKVEIRLRAKLEQKERAAEVFPFSRCIRGKVKKGPAMLCKPDRELLDSP